MMHTTFIEKVYSGQAKAEEIDKFIEIWHDSDIEMPLREYLGFTKKEYQLFGTEDAEKVVKIAIARLKKRKAKQ